jgi:hypothetical protein
MGKGEFVMTLGELQAWVDEAIKLQEKSGAHTGAADYPVMVKIDNPQVGPIAMTKVRKISLGFDFERGKVIIWTADPIRRYTN